MTRVIALWRACTVSHLLETARLAIVLFCAAALIAAGHTFPI